MDKMFELYKDGEFLGERPKAEVEQIAKLEEYGYRLLISHEGNDTGIAILERDPQKIKRVEILIKDFNLAMNSIIRDLKPPQSTLEGYRKALLRLLLNTSRPRKKKKR